jgi:hypothetical protein
MDRKISTVTFRQGGKRSMSDHTPGPWEWKKRAGHYYELIASKSGLFIHSDGSACGEYGADIDVGSPDANLIAAAPELLEALERTRDILFAEHGPRIYHANFAFINESIKKARGET